mgnify:CR=1 FL=1
MQSYEVTYETMISAKVTLSTQIERELRRDCEIERGEEIDECLASDYLDEVAEAINDAIKLHEKFKAANGCRVELEIHSTEQQ